MALVHGKRHTLGRYGARAVHALLLPVALALCVSGAVTAAGRLHPPRWVTVAVVVCVVLAVLEVTVLAPVRRLSRDLRRVRVTGDLAWPISVPAGPVRAAAVAAVGVVDAVHSVVGKVCFTSTLVADTATTLTRAAVVVGEGSGSQETAAGQALGAVEHVLSAADAVTAEAEAASQQAAASLGLSKAGAANVVQAGEQMALIARAVQQTAHAVDALGGRVRSIDGMVSVITGIAEQTNLLALNATIESARAGASGRGFAVVAHEVGQLAEHTAASTRQITDVVGGVRRDSAAVLELVARTAELAEQGADLAAEATKALEEIERSAVATTSSVESIIERARGQRTASERLHGEVDAIAGLARTNRDGAGRVHGHAGDLAHLATNLREIETVFLLGDRGRHALELHGRLAELVVIAARDVAAVLERLVDGRRLGLDDLFDEAYEPIAGTDPRKYHTRYDRLTDEVLPPVQEPLLDVDPGIIYAGAVDRRGYFPTHNLRFSRPLTGTYAVDLVRNRTKRIFDDPVGRRCGSHDLSFLVQTYRRDTGEVLHDISAPVIVRGRRWGGVRIGYQA